MAGQAANRTSLNAAGNDGRKLNMEKGGGPEGRRVDRLVGYFGLVQALHTFALAWEASGLLSGRGLSILAPAPAAGWPPASLAALIAMGAVDTLVAPASLIFVWGWFRRTRWSGWLGAVVLAAVLLSALAFAIVTIPSGVWGVHFAYTLEAILFVPIVGLAILYANGLLRNRPLPGEGAR